MTASALIRDLREVASRTKLRKYFVNELTRSGAIGKLLDMGRRFA